MSEGKQGAEFMARAAITFAVKKELVDFTASSVGDMFKEYDSLESESQPDFRAKIQNRLSRQLSRWYPKFLTVDLRENAVRLHARGNSTVNVVKHILSPASEVSNAFCQLREIRPSLEKPIIDWLTPRLAYLKLGTAGFPQKYLALWHTEREAYLKDLQGITLTDTAEQVKALSELYSRLDDAFSESETDKGKSLLANSMVKVMSGIFTLTRTPS